MVDDPLIVIALQAVLSAPLKLHRMEIGTGRAIGAGDRPPHQLAAVVVERVQRAFAAAHKLVLIAPYENGLPYLLQRHAVQNVQIFVRHLGSAVRQTLPLPQGGEPDDLVPIVEIHAYSSQPLCSKLSAFGRIRRQYQPVPPSPETGGVTPLLQLQIRSV